MHRMREGPLRATATIYFQFALPPRLIIRGARDSRELSTPGCGAASIRRRQRITSRRPRVSSASHQRSWEVPDWPLERESAQQPQSETETVEPQGRAAAEALLGLLPARAQAASLVVLLPLAGSTRAGPPE